MSSDNSSSIVQYQSDRLNSISSTNAVSSSFSMITLASSFIVDSSTVIHEMTTEQTTRLLEKDPSNY
ncbi:unnamed protein product [Rotaria sp. Silwood2]|nr:unnamed protein product [Rotaria sp. Silwood2]CAF3039156.1 unnamed protein product [Rotaria sp. Silwood2]CAF3989226.1 unnamed protein product [Rotaria sp. Silwood2]CAF4043466.1 unnamed protein product [Rotaria sp. Silwood2]